MKKHIIAALAVLMLGTAAIAQPAQAACWWNGGHWVCRPAPGWWWHRHHWWWRHHGWWWHRHWYPY